MILSSVEQCTNDELKHAGLDLFVAASGFESRSRHVARCVAPDARKLVALGFEEFRDAPERIKNDAFFLRRGYESRIAFGDDEDSPCVVLRECLSQNNARIAVDISSMTRAWYGSFVREIRAANVEGLTTYFAYAPSRFRRSPGKYPQNRFVGPVRGFSGLAPPHKPPALILGLGDHVGRALGTYLEVDPKTAAAFLASPTVDQRYDLRVKEVNAELLVHIKPEMRFEYPLLDFSSTFYRLEGVTRSLARDSAVVLASSGPKIFSLACMLVALSIEYASVWRVSAGDREGAKDAKPAGPIVVVKATWTGSASA